MFFQQADAFGQFFYAWELVLNFFDLYVVVGGNAHWGCDAVECILDLGIVLAFADKESDGRILRWSLDQIIHGIDVEVQLSGEFWLEGNKF